MNQEVNNAVDELLEKKNNLTAIKSKRENAVEFIYLSDNYEKKFDFKIYLNKILKDNPHRIEFIRGLYKLKLMNKSFKHLNLNTKRILLNNILREKVLMYSNDTGFAATDILLLLNNSNTIDAYIKNLIVIFKKLQDKAIYLK